MQIKTEQNNLNRLTNFDDMIAKLTQVISKKSFLVFAQKKYFTVSIEKIAFFRVKFESCSICCFDGGEHFINYSLEQIQKLVSNRHFFRINRQYLLNFHAVKEVEPFYGRKLIVNLIIPAKDALLVPADKVNEFLNWLDNR